VLSRAPAPAASGGIALDVSAAGIVADEDMACPKWASVAGLAWVVVQAAALIKTNTPYAD
jgi:hypothetical protein